MILCKLFGHRPEPGYYGDGIDGDCNRYFEVEEYITDGIGRRHAKLYTVCRRCQKRYQVGMIHLPSEE